MKKYSTRLKAFYILGFSLLVVLVLGTIACFYLYFSSYELKDHDFLFLYIGSIGVALTLAVIFLLVFRRNKPGRKFLRINEPIIHAISDYLFWYDDNTKTLNLTKHLAKFTGSPKETLTLGEAKALFVHPEKLDFNYKEMKKVAGSKVQKLELKNGKYISVSMFASKEGGDHYLVGYVNDFTVEYIEEQNLLKEAHLDSLTETYRRSYFVKNVKEKMADLNNKGALIFMDVDDFKNINDKFGHSYGDIVLMKMGNLLKNFAENKEVFLARAGGDEFLMYFYNIKDYNVVYNYLKDLIYAFKSISINEVGLKQVYVSMGVSLFPFQSNNYETLLKYADDALYRAKLTLGSSFAIYDEDKVHNELNISTINQKFIVEPNQVDIFKDLNLTETTNILKKALENKEFEIYIQPQVSLDGKSLNGECLCRWNKPKDGILLPANFIPLLERTNLIYAFDQYILEECLKISSKYIKDGVKTQLALNQSIKSIIDPSYRHDVTALLSKYKVQKGSIGVEITERAMFSGMRNITKAIELYHNNDLRVIIDDFGTGFTSLALIKDLNIDELKIDRSFLSNPHNDTKRCLEIIKGINEIAHSINMTTILEGVETKDEFKIAIDSKADYIQGFIIAKAITVEDYFKAYNDGSLNKKLKEIK